MATINDNIYLNFDFRRKDKYQGIYYGHLLDSTIAIGAVFEILEEDKGLIKKIKADFISDIIGGRINLGLNDFARNVELKDTLYDKQGNESMSIHQLYFSLDILEDTDDDFDPVEIEFDKPFNLNSDILQVLPYRKFKDRYVNYVAGMFATGTNDINDLRSCDVVLGNG